MESKIELKTRKQWEKHLGKARETPGVLRMKTFLESQAKILESMERSVRSDKTASAPHSADTLKTPSKKVFQPWLSKPKAVASPTTISIPDTKPAPGAAPYAGTCPCCAPPHRIFKCNLFRGKTVGEKKNIVIAKRLCFNCFGPHNLQACPSKMNCWKCRNKHHT